MVNMSGVISILVISFKTAVALVGLSTIFALIVGVGFPVGAYIFVELMRIVIDPIRPHFGLLPSLLIGLTTTIGIIIFSLSLVHQYWSICVNLFSLFSGVTAPIQKFLSWLVRGTFLGG